LNSLNAKMKQKSLMFPGTIDVKGIEIGVMDKINAN
jgi:hypothetical protein